MISRASARRVEQPTTARSKVSKSLRAAVSVFARVRGRMTRSDGDARLRTRVRARGFARFGARALV